MKKVNQFFRYCFTLAFCSMLSGNLVAQNNFLPGTLIKRATYTKLPNSFITNNGAAVKVNIIKNLVYLADDIVLGDTGTLNGWQRVAPPAGTSPVITFSLGVDDNFFINTRWPNGIIPFRIMSGFSAAEIVTIKTAMNHIMDRTNICFVARSNERNYVKIRKVTPEVLGFTGGNSYLGMSPLGSQDLNVSATNFGAGLIIHELGHAIGLLHEQMREDRDRFIEVKYNNIKPEHKGQFDKFDWLASDIGSYDFGSIMHYGPNAFSMNGLQTIVRRNNPADRSFGQRSGLSAADVAGINRMYPTTAGCSNIPLQGVILARDEMALNETTTVSVYAGRLHNFVDVYVRSGQRFTFTASATDYWYNKTGSPFQEKRNAAGTSNDGGQGLSRQPAYRVMSLVGEVFSRNDDITSYTGTHFGIGTSRSWTATRTGFLQLFANDMMPAGYGDNSGLITVTIKRIL